MKQVLLFTLLMMLFLGCENSEIPHSEVADESSVTPTHIALFEVEGMMCQKGCGAAIRKGLYDTGGVSEVEVLFNEENPVNEIKVYFDIKKTTTEKMIAVIGSLAEMRYSAKLKKVTESTIVNVKESSSEPVFNNNTPVEASTRIISLPNLTHLLNSLIK
ncbi:MAG TPA: heavy metal-associated domain-containing protein [Brumimicrobium sp.]|nr:heavy metal-associated domain-containing protein [Brumimicrobium sp.]